MLVSFPNDCVVVNVVKGFVDATVGRYVYSRLRFRVFRQVVSGFEFRPRAQRQVSFRRDANVLIVFGGASVVRFCQRLSCAFEVGIMVDLACFLLRLYPSHHDYCRGRRRAAYPSGVSTMFRFAVCRESYVSFDHL